MTIEMGENGAESTTKTTKPCPTAPQTIKTTAASPIASTKF